MPRQSDPPKRLAARVRSARLALNNNRRKENDLKEALYRVAYEAIEGGWSYRGLGEAIDVPHSTIENWCKIVKQTAENRADSLPLDGQ